MPDNIVVQFHEAPVDRLLADLDSSSRPGVAVGIAVGGKPVYRKGFGLASMDLQVALSPRMPMRVGSLTKQFTCLACLLLCEDGVASAEDPLGKYLPHLHPSSREVTLRQLMGHLSGLRDGCNLRFLFSGVGGRPVPSEEIVSFYRDIDDVNASPGATWMYSNGGYILLSAVIERIAGQALGEVLRTRILGPIGMHDTTLRPWDSDFMPNSASVHMLNSQGQYERMNWGLDFAGGGALMSSVDDMLRWLAHMGAPVVGSEASWRAMRTPQTLANGTSSGYGLGLWVRQRAGLEMISHAGGWLGGSAQMINVPAAALDVIVISNRHDAPAVSIADKILDACLPQPNSGQGSGRPIAVGVFSSPATGRVIQLFGRERQQLASIDGYEVPLEADSDGTLRPAGALVSLRYELTFTGNPAKPARVRFSDFGNVDELMRVPGSRDSDVGPITGCYISEATGTRLTVCREDNSVRLVSEGRFGFAVYDLSCIAEGLWLAKPSGGAAQWFSLIISASVGGLSCRSSALGSRALYFPRVD